jgi:heme-degrading monooxygenase HmoA
MNTKVIIKRKIIKGKEVPFLKLLRELRLKAAQQEGYISSESLIDPRDPNLLLIISKWKTYEDWNNWKFNDERKSIDEKLNTLQEGPTEYKPYLHGKYWAAAAQGYPLNLQTKYRPGVDKQRVSFR